MSEPARGGSAERPYIDKTHPEIYSVLVSAAKATREAWSAAGLDESLIELVNTRVSQINGCVTCLNVHVPALPAAGVDELKIDLLPAWRDAQIYSEQERVRSPSPRR
ncbi:carboxymuconolactone decarboxylase family protein [Yimella sp. cx-51]|uniref:carboxymuconolactone decarboxylase family protein n=1 Tax=Yimella sp. cx-51 TaxID=2770551 RepID=UPI001FCABCE6|nr:carboxymuconolactone decarboxylase family protein [Yimella sp. cx-51]